MVMAVVITTAYWDHQLDDKVDIMTTHNLPVNRTSLGKKEAYVVNLYINVAILDLKSQPQLDRKHHAWVRYQ